jgi:phosphoribosyl-AMP cyclohydrolase / phosphoribosyl-ATP pyrophosphohydrolase
MNELRTEDLDWAKSGGLLPAVVQDSGSGRVLMLGYVNREALSRTAETGRVTFFSRTRNRLWTKGETSGNFLTVVEIRPDCDRDALLILARPEGPTCHQGTLSCFASESGEPAAGFLDRLSRLIEDRRIQRPAGSYTTRLFNEGLQKIAQKLGEEAVETVVSMTQSQERTRDEAADLIYHLLVFLTEREIPFDDVVAELERRHAGSDTDGHGRTQTDTD